MKVFVAANNKGGVGKTGCSTMYAEYCALLLQKRTLLIDFDPQGNSSSKYLLMEKDPSSKEGIQPPIHPDYDSSDTESNWGGRSSIAGIFTGSDGKVDGVIPYPTHIEKLEIAPAWSEKLLSAERVRKNEQKEKINLRLYEFLNLEEVQDEYDIVVVDTAPSKGPLTVAAIKAATHILIPTVMEYGPIHGLYGMLQFWMQESVLSNEPKTKSELIGILANMYDSRTTLHVDLYNDLLSRPEVGKYLLKEKLGRRVAFAEADSNQGEPQTIFNLPDAHKAKQEAVLLCELISERMF